MLLLQTGISMAIVSLHLSMLRKVIRSAKREQRIPISERKDDFQGATPIHTYMMPLNRCAVRIGEIYTHKKQAESQRRVTRRVVKIPIYKEARELSLRDK